MGQKLTTIVALRNTIEHFSIYSVWLCYDTMEVHPSVQFSDPLYGQLFGPDSAQINLYSLR